MSASLPPLDALLSHLTPRLQDLFRRHCVDGETLLQIGEATGRSPRAMQIAVCLLRHRLQTILMQSGFSEQEARDYLYQVLTAHR